MLAPLTSIALVIFEKYYQYTGQTTCTSKRWVARVKCHHPLRLVHDRRWPLIKYISCFREICYKEDKNKWIGTWNLWNWFITHVKDAVLQGDGAVALRDPHLFRAASASASSLSDGTLSSLKAINSHQNGWNVLTWWHILHTN